MSVQLIGGSLTDAPFNRTFFNITLGELLDQEGKDKSQRLTLFLSDATQFEVCSIDKLSDEYLSLRAYQGAEDSCELAVHLIPYVLIYRIEISPKIRDSSGRVGFHRGSTRKGATSRRSR